MQDTSSKQVIHLGLTTLFAMQFMKEISTFLAQNPNVELIIKQGGSHELQKMLVNKEIDIGLVSFPNYQTEMINIDVLETTTRGYNVYVVVPENNPLASLEELTFKDLKGQRFSSLSDNFMIGRMLIDQSRAFGFEPNIVLYNDDLQVLIHSVVKNNSICLLPIEYRQVGKSEGVKWIPLKDKYNFFPIGIALRKDYLRTDVLDNFIGIIKEN
ncbi:LysR family transcriptional regulator substrate-binding protein [Vagococcus salmoninarum]